jgi:hypothetical protein
MNKQSAQDGFVLRPGVTNPSLWYPERPPKTQWDKIRKVVLERDHNTCISCGHRALKYMNIHHIEDGGENTPENLVTMCVACHAVLHIGKNLGLKIVEIWETPFSQVEVVQKTRAAVQQGISLENIKKQLKLKKGPHSPGSLLYADELVKSMGNEPRAYLPEPLSAVFVNLSRWQIE